VVRQPPVTGSGDVPGRSWRSPTGTSCTPSPAPVHGGAALGVPCLSPSPSASGQRTAAAHQAGRRRAQPPTRRRLPFPHQVLKARRSAGRRSRRCRTRHWHRVAATSREHPGQFETARPRARAPPPNAVPAPQVARAAEAGCRRTRGRERLWSPVRTASAPRPPVARRGGPPMAWPTTPNHLPLGGEQIGFIRGVTAVLTLGEIHQLQQPRHLARSRQITARRTVHLDSALAVASLGARPVL